MLKSENHLNENRTDKYIIVLFIILAFMNENSKHVFASASVYNKKIKPIHRY